jgi:hypothetical protein
MKKNLILIAALAMLVTAPAFSQFTFTAAPGLNLNSASFGYKFGKVVPFIGIQYMGANVNITLTGTEWGTSAPEEFTDEIKVKGSIFMPTIGVKYFAVEKNKVKGYVIGSFSKPMLNAKMTINGEENDNITDALDKISLWGATAGVGAEYFFDDNFSVGGEFGIQIIAGKYLDEYVDTYWNPNTSSYVDADFSDEVKVNLMPTYSKISLNFYF